MRFVTTAIEGAFIVEPDLREDERGFFARTWCLEEFGRQGIRAAFEQSNVSYNKRAGTLRGLHYQVAPHEESKLVRCTRGAIFDVAVDLRPQSPTFKRWTAARLDAWEHRALFIPEGCAHGFQTLTDETEVLYLMSGIYVPSAARTILWSDPAFAIEWPACEQRSMSARDAQAACFHA